MLNEIKFLIAMFHTKIYKRKTDKKIIKIFHRDVFANFCSGFNSSSGIHFLYYYSLQHF